MISLFIDTHQSTNLAIFQDKKLLKQVSSTELKQSTIIMPLLNNLLNQLDLEVNDITEIIVVNGPGSFTGVRLGVTIAKTIAFCLNISIKCINSLSVKAISDGFEHLYYAIKDTKGAYIGKAINKKLEIDYLLNNEVTELNLVTDVIYDISKLYDYEELFEEMPAHLINPIYVKKIEAQK